MRITNPLYLKSLKKLKKDYSDLPWYQRFWFTLWSYRLSAVLSSIDTQNPTTAQVEILLRTAEQSWFFNSIFGLLQQFRNAILRIPYEYIPPLEEESEEATEIEENQRLQEEPQMQISPTQTKKDEEPKSSHPQKEEIPSEPFPLERLPPVLIETLAHNLTSKDLGHFSQSASQSHSLFQSTLEMRQFLNHITRGNYDDVETMLRKNSKLFTQKGTVVDYSGRAFSHITGFEYALWALDKHMWTRMLHCLPPNKEGENIKKALLAQYQNIQEQGIKYSLKDQLITESHFDFQGTIIRQLQLFIGDNPTTEERRWGQAHMTTQWIEGVGGAQRLLPVHVFYEYSASKRLNQSSTFTEQPRQRKYFIDSSIKKEKDLFPLAPQLGTTYALVKAPWAGVFGCVSSSDLRSHKMREYIIISNDLAGIKKLYEVRTNDFAQLESQLTSAEENAPSTPTP